MVDASLYFLGGAVLVGIFLLFFLANRTSYRKITEAKNEAIKHYEKVRDKITKKQIKTKEPEPDDEDEDDDVQPSGSPLMNIVALLIMTGVIITVGVVVFSKVSEQISPQVMNNTTSAFSTGFSDAFSFFPVIIIVVAAAIVLFFVIGAFGGIHER